MTKRKKIAPQYIGIDAVRRIAHILGESSAAALALERAKEYESRGLDVRFFQHGSYLVVEGVPKTESESTQ